MNKSKGYALYLGCATPVKALKYEISASNLALAEERGMDMIGLCTGCVAVLSETKESLKNGRLRDKVNEKLRLLGVKEYSGRVTVKHFARFLFEDYGLDAV